MTLRQIQVFFLIWMYSSSFDAFGLDYGHFYRAALWRGEPRSAKPFIASIHSQFAGTSAFESFNAQGEKVPLLAIYGPEDLVALGVRQPKSQSCKNLSFQGQFRLSEIQFDYFANIDYGFFGHIHFPVRSFLLSDIRPFPTTKNCDAAFNSLLKVLRERKIGLDNLARSGLGDLSILTGWAWSTYDSSVFDFIDTMIEVGVLFPTTPLGGDCKSGNICNIMLLGQGGGFGFPLVGSIAFGFLNWLTWGIYGLGLFLPERTDIAMLRTSPQQQGFIRIESDTVRTQPGIVWDITTYIKADHFIRGLSILIGYSHNQKNRTFVFPFSSKFDPDVVNGDPIFRGWSMDILNTIIEYDWSNEDNPYGPRLALQYNYIIRGKRVFNAPTTGGYAGIDIQWRF